MIHWLKSERWPINYVSCQKLAYWKGSRGKTKAAVNRVVQWLKSRSKGQLLLCFLHHCMGRTSEQHSDSLRYNHFFSSESHHYRRLKPYMFRMLVKLYLVVMSPQDTTCCRKNGRYLLCNHSTFSTTKAVDWYYRLSVQKLLFYNDWYFLAQMIIRYQRARASDYKKQYWFILSINSTSDHFYRQQMPILFLRGEKANCIFSIPVEAEQTQGLHDQDADTWKSLEASL